MKSIVSNEQLVEIKSDLELANPTNRVRAWQIQAVIQDKFNTKIDESTIRGRFIEIGTPLGGTGGVKVTIDTPNDTQPPPRKVTQRQHIDDIAVLTPSQLNENLKLYVPPIGEFDNYILRDVDKRLAVHYNIGVRTGRYKYPLTQGKQGTGKTWSHRYYAFKSGLPFFLFSCYEDFKLAKLFGDKTIQNGSIVFQESLFVKAIQSPSVLLFDEINAISNSNTFDFHAFLQNRELYIKDADNGKGKLFILHPECRIGFAQNPKSAKYIGGNIKASNFLGRCTYLTYPEFTKKEVRNALKIKFPELKSDDLNNFTQYFFSIIQLIDRSSLPVDISIRQINNVVDLWLAGISLKYAIEEGLSSILDAVSQPTAKDSFFKVAQAIWKELI